MVDVHVLEHSNSMGSLILLLCITVLVLISNGCKHTTSNKKMKVNHGDGGAGESGFRGAEGSGAWDGIIGLCTEAGEGATGDEKAMPPDGCPGKAAHKERASKMRIGGRLPTLGCNTQSWVCLQGKRPLCCKPPHNWGIFRLIFGFAFVPQITTLFPASLRNGQLDCITTEVE